VGVGMFAPAIYAMGVKMAIEGATQSVQQITQGDTRKKLLNEGRTELENKAIEKIKELEGTDKEKYTQAMMEWIDDNYAREVATAVENDTAYLKKMEKLRGQISMIGSIGVILLGGMPMDLDGDKITHFVNIFKGSYNEMGSTISRTLVLNQMNTTGILYNMSSALGGIGAGFLFSRLNQGDMKEYKLKVGTTKEQQEQIGEIKKEEKVENARETVPKTEEADIKEEIEKDKEEEKKLPFDEIVEKIDKLNTAEKLGRYYSLSGGMQKQLAGIKLMAEFSEEITLEGNEKERKEYFDNVIVNIRENIIGENKVSKENAKIINEWIDKFKESWNIKEIQPEEPENETDKPDVNPEDQKNPESGDDKPEDPTEEEIKKVKEEELDNSRKAVAKRGYEIIGK